MREGLRILCIAPMYPWPAVDGYRLRFENLLLGLAEAGTVDLFTFERSIGGAVEAPPDERIRWTPTLVDEPRTTSQWIGRWLTGDLPRQALLGWYRSVLSGPSPWSHDDYHVVYIHDVPTWLQFRDALPPIPIVIDVSDVPSVLVGRRRRRGPSLPSGASRMQRFRRRITRGATGVLDIVDERRWRRWEARAREEVAAFTVCSTIDAEALATPKAIVVPNGYELSWPARDHAPAVAAPVILFVGLLSYPPNADAARWFATEVFPELRLQHPEAVLRIVGRDPEALSDLRGLHGVELVGEVATMQGELERADLSVVPIRHGGGTRLKVIEALANGLPCVSTTVGCEGIDVVDGQHLLIADGVESFVAACSRALGDEELRGRLAANGADLYASTYRWSNVRRRFADVARSVAAPTSS